MIADLPISRPLFELAGIIAFIVVFSVVAYSSLLDGAALRWWTDIAWTIAALATAFKCLSLVKKLTNSERHAWRLIAFACFAWFLGMVVWDYYELVLGEVTPFPAFSDLGFLAFAAFFMAAFVVFRAKVNSRAFTLVQIAKLGILVCSIIIAHLIVFLEPLKQLNGDVLYISMVLAYPVLYMATLVYGLICLWHFFGAGIPRGLLLVSLGFAVHAFVDSFYAYGLLGKTYAVGGNIDVMWLVGFGLIYGGALAAQYSPNVSTLIHMPKVSGRIFSFDALVPVIAVFTVLLVSFLYSEQLTSDTIQAIFPLAFILVVFLGLGEIASQSYQQEMRDKLTSSEKQLSSILATIPNGVQEIDTEGNILFSNEAHDVLFGCKKNELLGKNITTLFDDPQERAELKPYLKYLVEHQQKPSSFSAKNRKMDGSNFLVQVDWDYKRAASGEVIGFTSILTDITEKKRAEEELRQAAAVFESTSEGIIVTDANGDITAVNQAFTGITGYSEQEVLGKNPRMLRSDHHDADFFRDMWKTIKKTSHWRGEIWDRRKNGEVFPVLQSVSAIKDKEGEITHYVSVFSDISSLKQTQEQLNYLAYHDPLTDLPNRLLFNDRLTHATERAGRSQDQVGLLFIDLDHFKRVNDSLGHQIGDELLINASRRLRNLVRKDDTVARLGGDEFVVILESIRDAEDTVAFAQKLIEAFNEPFMIEYHELHVTMSIGISVFPADGTDMHTLVKNADAALYYAKEEGRNGFHCYTEELTSSALERLQLTSALRNAVKNEELLLYYQPQISLNTGKIVGLEALLRWKHPEFGLLAPNRFIGLAEDSGLILSIGEWVLKAACVQLKAWQQQGYDFGRIAVNVSGLQLQRGDLQHSVKVALKASQLSPQYLELEITENFIMKKTERAIAVLDKLKSLGIQIAIDDFGTGYSSLSYLKRLPIDKLKIDASFVRDIPHDSNDEAIARAVVALAKSMNLKVIAEGVETNEQKIFLMNNGCDEAQGNLFGKAVPGSVLLEVDGVFG